jgi:Secretory lipase
MPVHHYRFIMMPMLAILFLVACNDRLVRSPATATPEVIPIATSITTSITVSATSVMATNATSATITATTAVSSGTIMTPDTAGTTVITPVNPVTATNPITPSTAITTAAALTTTVATTASTANTATGAAAEGALQPGAILNSQLIETVAVDEINRLSATFYPASNLIDALYAVDIYRLTVQSTDELGAAISTQADLFIPRVNRETAFPLLGYAPGTTGLGDSCPPSQEYAVGRQWGDYRTHMLSYAGQGFIGLLPDGMSYTNPDRPHEYFIAELEAYTLLDAARAGYAFFTNAPATVKARPRNALFFAGYSNGGHTAFAAKDFAAAYAPELPLSGVISHGATTNVEALLRESPIFTPYLIYAYRHFFGADVIGPEDVFLDKWLPSFDQDALTKCVDDLFVYYTNDPQGMYRPEFRRALFNGSLVDRYPVFKAVLDANYAGTFGGFTIPVAFFQGTADYVVTPESQQNFARLLCSKEEPVTYVTLPAVQHVNTRQVSFKASMAWMRGIVNGQTPQNNCAQIAVEE